jgi:lysozyme
VVVLVDWVVAAVAQHLKNGHLQTPIVLTGKGQRMGGNVGEAIAQAGLGFMQGAAEAKFAQHLDMQQRQQKSAMELGQALAARGELANLPPDMIKPMEKLYGKAGMGQLMQLNQINQVSRNLRLGAEQSIQAPVETQVAVPNPDLQGPVTPQGEAPLEHQTMQRAATPQEQYERFIQMDPTGISLITGDTNFGNLALNTRILAQNKAEHMFNVQKQAYEDTKPHTTATFDIERPDGSLGTGVAQVFPDGSHHVIDLSDTANKDELSRLIDRKAKLDEQLEDQALTPQQRKTLQMRNQKNDAALEKALSKDPKKGFNLIFDEEGNIAGFTDDPNVAKNMLGLQGALKGLDRDEMKRDRKIVRGGALMLNNIDRILNMADPATFGPGATVTQFMQNLKANIQSIPGVAEFVNGSRSDIKSAESKALQNKILKDFNGAPTEAHQYMMGLIVQMAKMDDPDSVIREGEYDRYKAQIMGGAGVAGSFPAMVTNLKAIRNQTQDKINQSMEQLNKSEQLILQRMQGQMGGETFGQSVNEAVGARPGQPEQQQSQGGMPSFEQIRDEMKASGIDYTPEMYQQDQQEFLSSQKKNSEVSAVTPKGHQLLAEFEGMRTEMYDDATGETINDPSDARGYATIGIGHLLTKEEKRRGKIEINGELVDYRNGLSEEQVFALLDQDSQEAAEIVDKYVKVDLTPAQHDALVSFAFNIGEGNFKSSGAIKALNNGDIDGFLKRHALWNKSKGKEMRGLTRRREAEAELFLAEA